MFQGIGKGITLQSGLRWISTLFQSGTSGNSAQLDLALTNGVQELKVYGFCSQSGTPTAVNPVPVVCNNGEIVGSKNMCNVTANTVVSGKYIAGDGSIGTNAQNFYYSVFIPAKPNTQYTLALSSAVYYLTISEYATAQDNGFVKRNNPTQGYSNTSLTITTDATTNYLRFGANLTNTGTATTDRVLAINWMLTEGGTAETYHPYKDWWVEGTSEVVAVEGKNLFDISTVGIEQGSISSNAGANDSSYYRVRTTNYCPVNPDTTYTISALINEYTGNSSSGLYVFEYSVESVEGYVGSSAGWKNPNGYTFTTRANTRFIRLTFAKDNTSGERTTPSDVSNVQLEYGGKATPYQPYSAPQTASVSNLFAVGDAVDEQSIRFGNIERKCGVCVYDGTEEVGNTFISSTGGKDFLAVIVYPLANSVSESVSPQPINNTGGNITITANKTNTFNRNLFDGHYKRAIL